jgi:diguanylate cyclase (GGDEF)-like protein
LVTARILSKPIKELTAAAQKIGSGEFNVELPDSNIKEIRILSETLRNSSNKLSKFTKNMEDMIYKDDLTHVKNKAAYTIAIDTIQDKMATDPDYKFAVAMFDLNFLKTINDKYGHEAGDIAIKTCCKIICEVFEHSPVFRIGGDEFVAILTDKDYDNREKLEKELADRIKSGKRSATHIYEAVSIAYGIAVYDRDRDPHYINVFSRADNEMYNCKKKDHLEVGTAPR